MGWYYLVCLLAYYETVIKIMYLTTHSTVNKLLEKNILFHSHSYSSSRLITVAAAAILVL